MGKGSRWQRGRMPDVPLEHRDADTLLLTGGAAGPFIGGELRHFEFREIHPALQEMLVRMDKQEVANLKQGVAILVRFEPEDFKRLRTVLKLVNILFGIGKVLKWSLASFTAGLAAVVLMGEQLQKIWGWLLNILKVVRP